MSYTKTLVTKNGTLWTADKTTGAVTVDKSANLKARLGVATKLMQDENKISAIAQPVDFIKKRKAEIEGWFAKGGAVEVFHETIYNDYMSLGFTEEQADANATRAAELMYQQKMAILDYSNPGAYDLSYNTVGLQHNQQIAAASLTEADIIRKYKDQKKQQKALH